MLNINTILPQKCDKRVSYFRLSQTHQAHTSHNYVHFTQRRSVGYLRSGRTAILPLPKSREMPDDPYHPYFAVITPNFAAPPDCRRGGPPLATPLMLQGSRRL